MITLFPALIPSTVSFQGGGAVALVRALSRQSVQPVAVFADPNLRIRSFLGVKRKIVNPANLAKLTSLLSCGSTFGISSRDLPPGFLMQDQWSDYYQQFEKRAGVEAKDGKIVIDDSRSNWVSINDLVQLRLKKPISCHWVYRKAFVAVSGGAFDEDTLLRTVSDALGARWSDKSAGYRIEFDATSHRARAIETYRSSTWRLPEGEYPGRKQLYARAAEASTDETWAEAFRTNGSTAIQLGLDPRGPAASEGWKGLQSLVENARKTKQSESYRILSTIFSGVDREKPPRLQIQSDGRHHVDFPMADGKGWTGL